MRCKNPNSKFKGILHNDIINGKHSHNFVFQKDSECCFWPVNSSLQELIQDGWVVEGRKVKEESGAV